MTQFELLTWLIPLPPIVAFFAIVILTNRSNRLSHTLAVGAMGVSWAMAMAVFWKAVTTPELGLHPFESSIPWLPTGSGALRLGVLIDPLSAVTLFFVACDEAHGCEPWRSDGTSATLLADTVPGAGTTVPLELTDVAGALFFAVCTGPNDCELWRSDGVTTAPIAEVPAAPGPSGIGYPFPTSLTAFGGAVYFRACDDAHGCELWRSDGVTTALFHDIVPGAMSSHPGGFVDVNGTLLFTASDPVGGHELRKIDGGATTVVAEGNQRALGSLPADLVAAGTTVFLRATDPVNGSQLWKSDGTDAGTAMVKDINPSSNSSSPTYLTDVGGTLFFRAANGLNGTELSVGPPWFWGTKNPLEPYVGKSVTVTGRMETDPPSTKANGKANNADGPEFEVYTVNGSKVRAEGKPPWAGGPKAVGERHPGYAGWSNGKADKADKAKAAPQP